MHFIRPAGFNERRCVARDSLYLYGSIVTLGTYVNDSSATNSVASAALYQALKYCITRHPVLGVVIQDAVTEKPWLGCSSSIDLSQHVHVLGDIPDGESSVQAILEQLHNILPANYEKRPQWNVYVLHRSDRQFHLAFACSHALVDGRSSFAFQKTFLEALNDLATSRFDGEPIFDLPELQMILPPLELAANLAISWSFLLGPLLNEYTPGWIMRAMGFSWSEKGPSGHNSVWTGAIKRPAKPPEQLPRTCVQTAEVSMNALQSTLAVCRARNARLTGLLVHLGTRALARALKAQGESYNTFKIGTAVDLRNCIPQSKGKMANFVSATSEVVTVDSTELHPSDTLSNQEWEEIQQITQRLHQASNTLSDQPVGLLKYLSNYRNWTLKKAQATADSSFEISNLGRFDGRSPADATSLPGWTVEQMAFSQSADGTGSPFNLNVASVNDGPLLLVLTWWPGMFGVKDERRLAKEVCDGIVRQLQHLSN